MSAVRKPTKKPAPPPYRSSAPVCDCGSGIPRSETAEIPSSGGRRGCEKCYNRKYAAYADSDGGGEYSDDPSSGSGWHYSRNPPQRYTVTEGGRRVRLAGGNVFPSKGEAQRAVQFLRATEGGDYRVRAIKPGESVGRVAAVNGKKSTRSRKKRGATSVRRAMSNPITEFVHGATRYAVTEGSNAFGKVAYYLDGPNGARYGLMRNANNPKVLFAVNALKFGGSTPFKNKWFSDEGGSLHFVVRL